MNYYEIIALDGPAGVGKSSLARRIAQERHLPFLDTGAMFRTLAYYLQTNRQLFANAKNPKDRLQIAITACASLNFSLTGFGNKSILSCNERPIGAEIRTETVALLAAHLAQNTAIRECLKASQRTLGKDTALVCEGRDMGTVIFPDAQHKFFLDASPEIRAQRRHKQLSEAAHNTENPSPVPDLATLTQQIIARDKLDRERSIAPLQAAEDAHIIDTSQLNEHEVFERIMHLLTAPQEDTQTASLSSPSTALPLLDADNIEALSPPEQETAPFDLATIPLLATNEAPLPEHRKKNTEPSEECIKRALAEVNQEHEAKYGTAQEKGGLLHSLCQSRIGLILFRLLKR